MKLGMLWYDDDPKRLIGEKIARAVDRFYEKYGYNANLVYANPATVGAESFEFEYQDRRKQYKNITLTIKPAKSILPNHFWLGKADA